MPQGTPVNRISLSQGLGALGHTSVSLGREYTQAFFEQLRRTIPPTLSLLILSLALDGESCTP